MAEPDPRLIEAFQARCRGEVGFVATIASLRQVGWADALKTYQQCFDEAGRALLERADRAKARREGSPR